MSVKIKIPAFEIAKNNETFQEHEKGITIMTIKKCKDSIRKQSEFFWVATSNKSLIWKYF